MKISVDLEDLAALATCFCDIDEGNSGYRHDLVCLGVKRSHQLIMKMLGEHEYLVYAPDEMPETLAEAALA